MKKLVSAIMAAALVMALAVSSFAAPSKNSTGVVSTNPDIMAQETTKNLTAEEVAAVEDLKKDLDTNGEVHVFDVSGPDGATGTVTLPVNVPSGFKAVVQKYHNGEWITLSYSLTADGISVYMDGEYCPVVISVVRKSSHSSSSDDDDSEAAPVSVTTGVTVASGYIAAGTSPKTGLY